MECKMPALKLLSALIIATCFFVSNSHAQSEEGAATNAALDMPPSAQTDAPAPSEDPASSAFPGTLTPTRTYKFEKGTEKAHKDSKASKESMGTLKFHEEKSSVRLEFEGRGMEKGKYQIVKTDSCEKLRRRLLSNKPVPADSELFAFDTEYGHISTEKNLHGKKLSDLELETTALALIKVDKHSARYVSCAH